MAITFANTPEDQLLLQRLTADEQYRACFIKITYGTNTLTISDHDTPYTFGGDTYEPSAHLAEIDFASHDTKRRRRIFRLVLNDLSMVNVERKVLVLDTGRQRNASQLRWRDNTNGITDFYGDATLPINWMETEQPARISHIGILANGDIRLQTQIDEPGAAAGAAAGPRFNAATRPNLQITFRSGSLTATTTGIPTATEPYTFTPDNAQDFRDFFTNQDASTPAEVELRVSRTPLWKQFEEAGKDNVFLEAHEVYFDSTFSTGSAPLMFYNGRLDKCEAAKTKEGIRSSCIFVGAILKRDNVKTRYTTPESNRLFAEDAGVMNDTGMDFVHESDRKIIWRV